MKRIQQQRGFTLIELMIGMILGLMMSALAVFFFSAEKKGFRQDQEIARMNENARFAMYVLSQELQLAGFWGEHDNDPASIDHAAVDLLIMGGTSCVTSGDFDPTVSLESKMSDTASNAETQFGCLTEGELQTVSVGGAERTSALAIKRVDGLATGELTANLPAAADDRIYLRTNGTDSEFFIYDTAPDAPLTGYTDWRYRINTYFIRNFSVDSTVGIPTLARFALVAGPAMQQETLAEGVEYFHVLFGVDTDADGVANQYFSNPTPVQLGTVVAARIYVLVRSLNKVDGYANDKTYTLGDIDIDQADDEYYRRVYTSSIQIRNIRNRISPLT